MRGFIIKRTEIIPLDYSAGCFVGVIVKETWSHGINLNIYIKDICNNKFIYIGRVSNRKCSISECRKSAIDLLNDEDFCWACWRDYLNEEE